MPTVVRPTRKPQPSRKKAARPKQAAPAKQAARPKKAVPAKQAARPKKVAPRKRATAAGREQPASWAELAGKAAPIEARRRERHSGIVDAVPTLRFAVLLALACTVLTLYVGHLYASQALVEQVQELRKERHRLVLQQNRLAAEFDRMTSPAVVLDRAAALGLRPSGHYGPTIVVSD